MCIFSWIGQLILIVWEFICMVWDWFGANSGQIQIIIALVALCLACKGYFRVLEQIKISIKQMKIASKQRGFELKFNLLNMIDGYMGRIKVIKKDISILKLECLKQRNVVTDPNMHEIITNMYSNLEKLDNSLERTLTDYHGIKERLMKYKRLPHSLLESTLLKLSTIDASLSGTESSIQGNKETLNEIV